MTLRDRSAAAPSTRWGAVLLIASAGVGGMVAGLPTLAVQIALVLGVAASTATVVLARANAVLNPAWVIVAWLYLIAPIGLVLGQAGVGLSPAALLVVGPSPFVLAALFMRPQTRDRLVLLLPLLLLLTLGALSLTWSRDPIYGAAKLNLWILAGLLPAAFVLVLAPGSNGTFWKVIAAAALLTAIGMIVLGADTALYPGRRTIFDSNPIWLARAVFIGVLVVLFSRFSNLVRLTTIPVMIVAGLMTVSLGPAVGLLIGAWAGAAETLRCAGRADRRVALGWGVLGLIGVIAAILVAIGVLSPASSPLAGLIVDDPNVTSRATFLGAALSSFLEAPLFGVGIGGFAAGGLAAYPHNMIAEIAVELGSIGILIFVAWTVLALRRAAGSPLLVALVVATGFYSLFSGSLAGNAEFWMFSALAVARFPIGGNGHAREALAVERG